MKSKYLYLVISIILLLGFVIAVEWTPQGTMNMRNVYNITNVPYYNGTDINITGYYYGDGSQLTNLNIIETLWNANYSTFLTHIDWGIATNGTLMLTEDWNATNTSYYLDSNPDNFIDWSYPSNGTLAYNSTFSNYYTLSEINEMNTSNNNYILYTNGTMKSYVNSEDTRFNNTLKSYIDSQDSLFNTSNNNYILYTNTTMKNYVDTRGYLTSYTETDPLAYNGTLAYNSSLSNYYLNSNPSGYISSYSETDPYWLANYSDFLIISAWNDTGLIKEWDPNSYIKDWDPNGYIKDWNSTGYIKDWSYIDTWDTSWLANWSAYNTTWSTDTNTWDTSWFNNWTVYNTSWSQDTTYTQGTNMSFSGTQINWDGSWAESVFAKITQLTSYVKWSDLWNQVYNETEIDAFTLSHWTDDLGNRGYTSLSNFTDNVFGNSTIARIGDCPEGQFIQNTTTGGNECTAPAGGGDITAVYTTLDNYLYNGSASGDIYLRFNDTLLNDTIDNRDTDTTYTVNGVLLDLTGTVFSVNEGTLTNGKGCKFVTGTGVVCDQTYLTSYTESDPIWSSNYTAYNDSWSLDTNTWDTSWFNNWTVYNTTWSTDTTYSDLSEFNDDILWTSTFNSTGDTRWTTETYVNLQNTSMKNYVDSNPWSFITSSALSPYVQWTTLWNQVYNETEVDAINISMKNYVDSNPGNYITSLLSDTSPQLGGNLDANAYEIQLDSNNKLCLDGATCSHYIYYNGTATIIS